MPSVPNSKTVNTSVAASPEKHVSATVTPRPVKQVNDPVKERVPFEHTTQVDQPWQEVPKKHSFACKTSSIPPEVKTAAPMEESPPVSDAFKNLRKVDELERPSGSKLSKAQKKRLKRSSVKVSPPPSH